MKKIFFILFILYAFPVSAAKILTTNPLEITDINLSKDPYIDSQYHLLLQLSLASHHHAYLDQFKVTISQAKVLDFKVSPIVNFYDKISKKYKKGLPAGKGLLKVTFQSLHPEPLKKINFQLRYQACTEKYCLLPITLTKEARVGTSTAAINKKPQSFSDIFKNPSLINHFLKNNLLLAFLIVFIAGFLTSLTPCIYPMIPITLTVLGAKTPNPLKGFLLACSYVLGIAITFLDLSLLLQDKFLGPLWETLFL
ncbi:MAG: hypothetical protein D6797_06460 [Bdellovibrio sp.]|nr:MAG: hypothetical protein D6797_06460 [Bdellovibrio sp.]